MLGSKITLAVLAPSEKLRCDELLSSDGEDDEEAGETGTKQARQRNPQYNRFRDAENPRFFVCQEFGNKKDIKSAIKQHSIETRRDLKIVKNDKYRLRVICRGKVPGSGEVPCDSDINSKSTQESIDTATVKCPWTIHASQMKGTSTWQIKTFVETHLCLQSRKISACTSRFLARGLTEQIRTNLMVPVGSLQNDLESKYEINISRSKAFRAKMEVYKLLVGSFKKQYGLLWDYCNELKRANPGTTMRIELEPYPNTDASSRVFKRVYCCLGPMKQGFFDGCRPLLGLDGTFLKGPFPGQLLTAVATDANNGIYPLAYAIVEAENMKSWEWFLECLGDDVGLTPHSNFCFISDRQKGLIPALVKLFPAAEHRFCLKHIYENFKLVHKGLAYKDLLWKSATATNVHHFDKAMTKMKNLDVKAWQLLKAIQPCHWSKSHFSEFPKSDLLYNNLCETFNSKIVKARDKPIITCLEGVMDYLMKRVVMVQKEIEKCNTILCPNIQEQFEVIKKKAAPLRPSWNGASKYKVCGQFGEQCVVDLQLKTCSCRLWDVSAMPCKHAVRAIWANVENGGDGVPENWVDDCYKLSTWKKIYSHTINPINGMSMWTHAEGLNNILPPFHHPQPGRPKKAQRKSREEIASQARASQENQRQANRRQHSGQGENQTQPTKKTKRSGGVTCTKCGNIGHNQRTCQGQGGTSNRFRVNKRARNSPSVEPPIVGQETGTPGNMC